MAACFHIRNLLLENAAQAGIHYQKACSSKELLKLKYAEGQV